MNQEKAGSNIFFLDTYALYEFALGNDAYKKYFTGVGSITTIMNLYELYYSLLRENLSSIAENFLERFLPVCVQIEPKIVKEAAIFRLQNKKLDLSYIDTLGYATAKKHNAKFLTGDEKFKSMDNVEFVK